MLASQDIGAQDEPQVLLWKSCCLKETISRLYDEKPPRAGTRGQRYYYQNLLRDACSLTSVPRRGSKLKEGVVVYSQYYNAVKHVWEATKLWPFANDGVEELTIDSSAIEGAREIAGGRCRRTIFIVQAYSDSKHRTLCANRVSQRKSFGIREEQQAVWSLFEDIFYALQNLPRERFYIHLEARPS